MDDWEKYGGISDPRNAIDRKGVVFRGEHRVSPGVHNEKLYGIERCMLSLRAQSSERRPDFFFCSSMGHDSSSLSLVLSHQTILTSIIVLFDAVFKC
jgi:hypothetical protein